MKRAIAVSGLAFLFMNASTWAEGADASADAPRWFDAVAGKKLVAVDDSTITVEQSEDAMAVEIVSPSGAERDLTLSFVGDGVGTISDGGPHPTGVFHETDAGLEADFSDGHTEAFTLNSEGGISMVLNMPASNSYCVRWFPQGHVFDVADRKAALAAYASKLGLSDSPAPKDACGEAQASAPSAKTHHVKAQKHDAPAPTQLASTKLVAVRDSQVHSIDPPDAPEGSVQPVAMITQSAPQIPVPQAAPPAPQIAPPAAKVPVPAPQPMQIAATEKAPAIGAASSCLNVDTDGSGWGFRNTCGYTVQFAYCLKNATGKPMACGTGTGSGNVPGNGFYPVLANTEIVTAEEEFRWVACAGRADQVAAHLDRPDPPAGRCVPVRAL